MTHRQEYALFCQIAVGATLAVAMAMLAACYAPPPRVVTTTTTVETTPAVATLRPPPVREEVIPAAPSERVVWHPGRWSWDGTGYVWIAGHWSTGHIPTRCGARPLVDHGNGWVWDEGHWRPEWSLSKPRAADTR